MFDPWCEDDPLTPTGGTLLAEIGVDVRDVRDLLADERVRRCPDREAPEDEK